MVPVSTLLLMVCLANQDPSHSTETDSGQWEQSIALLPVIAKDVQRLREELVRVEQQQQQRLSAVIEEVRRMLEERNSTRVTTVSPLPRCPREFQHRNSKLRSCYFFSKTRLSWADAAEDCNRRGSHLADLQTKEESDYVNISAKRDVYWLGGNYIARGENVWVWSSREPFTYTNWGLQQPNGEINFNCVMMSYDNTWVNRGCSVIHRYICEMRGQ